MMLKRCLLIAVLFACSSDPHARANEDILGTWQKREVDPSSIVRSSFRSGGDYEVYMRIGQQPEATQRGRWRIVGAKEKSQLETCVDGDSCERDGLWKTENVFVSGEVLTTTSPNGGPSTHWFRYGKR